MKTCMNNFKNFQYLSAYSDLEENPFHFMQIFIRIVFRVVGGECEIRKILLS